MWPTTHRPTGRTQGSAKVSQNCRQPFCCTCCNAGLPVWLTTQCACSLLSRSKINAGVQSCVPGKGGCSTAQHSTAQHSTAQHSTAHADLTAIQVQVGLTIRASPGDCNMVPLAIGRACPRVPVTIAALIFHDINHPAKPAGELVLLALKQ